MHKKCLGNLGNCKKILGKSVIEISREFRDGKISGNILSKEYANSSTYDDQAGSIADVNYSAELENKDDSLNEEDEIFQGIIVHL